MSVLSDLFEGNFSNIGTDISHAPSSFVRDLPSEEPYLIGAGLLGGGLLLGPEIAGALGATDAAAGAGAADLAGLTGGTVGDISAGTADILGTSTAADIGAGLADTAAIDALPADLASTEGASLAGDVADTSALGFAPASDIASTDSSLSSFLANPSADTSGLTSGTVSDISSGASDVLGTPTSAATSAPAAAASATQPSYVIPSVANAETAQTGLNAANATFGTFTPPADSSSGLFGTGISGGTALKYGLAAAPLALTLAMGQPSLPASAQQLQGQAAALQSQGLQNLQQAQAGVLNSGQTAQIATMQQNLTNQWLQTLKNQGVADPTKDTRWPQIQAAIDTQVTAATAQLIQQNITNALQETGQASTALTSIAQMQLQSDQAFTNNLVNATKSLGLAAGTGTALKLVAA